MIPRSYVYPSNVLLLHLAWKRYLYPPPHPTPSPQHTHTPCLNAPNMKPHLANQHLVEQDTERPPVNGGVVPPAFENLAIVTSSGELNFCHQLSLTNDVQPYDVNIQSDRETMVALLGSSENCSSNGDLYELSPNGGNNCGNARSSINKQGKLNIRITRLARRMNALDANTGNKQTPALVSAVLMGVVGPVSTVDQCWFWWSALCLPVKTRASLTQPSAFPARLFEAELNRTLQYGSPLTLLLHAIRSAHPRAFLNAPACSKLGFVPQARCSLVCHRTWTLSASPRSLLCTCRNRQV